MGSPEGRHLVDRLMADLTERYPEDGPGTPSRPEEFEPPDGIFLLGFFGREAVACGAFRKWREGIAEIKRMYVAPEARGRGFSRGILAELENAARRRGYRSIRLETGTRQPEALRLYESAGYHRLVPYGEFKDSVLSVCFEKGL